MLALASAGSGTSQSSSLTGLRGGEEATDAVAFATPAAGAGGGGAAVAEDADGRAAEASAAAGDVAVGTAAAVAPLGNGGDIGASPRLCQPVEGNGGTREELLGGVHLTREERAQMDRRHELARLGASACATLGILVGLVVDEEVVVVLLPATLLVAGRLCVVDLRASSSPSPSSSQPASESFS